MHKITALEYSKGTKVIVYSYINKQTADIKKMVHRLIGDDELKQIKEMSLNEVNELVNRILNEGTIFDN